MAKKVVDKEDIRKIVERMLEEPLSEIELQKVVKYLSEKDMRYILSQEILKRYFIKYHEKLSFEISIDELGNGQLPKTVTHPDIRELDKFIMENFPFVRGVYPKRRWIRVIVNGAGIMLVDEEGRPVWSPMDKIIRKRMEKKKRKK